MTLGGVTTRIKIQNILYDFKMWVNWKNQICLTIQRLAGRPFLHASLKLNTNITCVVFMIRGNFEEFSDDESTTDIHGQDVQ
jgi:hypothetical protein